MRDDYSDDIQPMQINPREIIIEDNHSTIKKNIKENKSNDEYQDDYQEDQWDRRYNEEKDDKPEQIQIEKTQKPKGINDMIKYKEVAEEEQYQECQRNNQIDENEMESISEAEIEEDQKQNKITSQLIQEDYNQVFDDIIKKNKQNLIFKDSNSSNRFKPLTMMKKNNSNAIDSGYKQKHNFQNSEKSTTSNPKVPIEFILYDEAQKRREKIDKVEYNNMMNIILTSSKAKISNNSQKIAISIIEKKIEEAAAKRERNKHLTFINIGEILTELNIFREILPKNHHVNSSNSNPNSSSSVKRNQTYQSYKEIQKEMINVKENEKRKQSEINFYEQFWLIINPSNKQEIKADMMSEILKILFAPINANVKDISDILKQFLMTAFFLNCNPDEVKKYVSPITEKDIPEEDIWSIERIVKEFLLLKENHLAYQQLKHLNKNIQNDIIKSEKEISFKPTIIGLGNYDKNSKWNYFEERLPALIEREQLRLQVLEEMKKESEEADLKECTFKPDINPSKIYMNKKKKKESADKSDTNSNNNNNNESIYEKLYTSNKGKDEMRKLEKEASDKKEETKTLAECSFQPKLISSDTYHQSFNNSEYPKGFQEYVSKMQHGIIEAQKKKYNEKR